MQESPNSADFPTDCEMYSEDRPTRGPALKPYCSWIIALLLTGCSNQQLYNAIQENRRMECGKLPQNQFEECMRDYDTSFQEYERDREE